MNLLLYLTTQLNTDCFQIPVSVSIAISQCHSEKDKKKILQIVISGSVPLCYALSVLLLRPLELDPSSRSPDYYYLNGSTSYTCTYEAKKHPTKRLQKQLQLLKRALFRFSNSSEMSAVPNFYRHQQGWEVLERWFKQTRVCSTTNQNINMVDELGHTKNQGYFLQLINCTHQQSHI